MVGLVVDGHIAAIAAVNLVIALAAVEDVAVGCALEGVGLGIALEHLAGLGANGQVDLRALGSKLVGGSVLGQSRTAELHRAQLGIAQLDGIGHALVLGDVSGKLVHAARLRLAYTTLNTPRFWVFLSESCSMRVLPAALSLLTS